MTLTIMAAKQLQMSEHLKINRTAQATDLYLLTSGVWKNRTCKSKELSVPYWLKIESHSLSTLTYPGFLHYCNANGKLKTPHYLSPKIGIRLAIECVRIPKGNITWLDNNHTEAYFGYYPQFIETDPKKIEKLTELCKQDPSKEQKIILCQDKGYKFKGNEPITYELDGASYVPYRLSKKLRYFLKIEPLKWQYDFAWEMLISENVLTAGFLRGENDDYALSKLSDPLYNIGNAMMGFNALIRPKEKVEEKEEEALPLESSEDKIQKRLTWLRERLGVYRVTSPEANDTFQLLKAGLDALETDIDTAFQKEKTL